MGIARTRLQEERKSWRKDHPHVRARALPPSAPRAARPFTRAGLFTAGVCGEAEQSARRDSGHPQLGGDHPGQGEDDLGERAHPDDHVTRAARAHHRTWPPREARSYARGL